MLALDNKIAQQMKEDIEDSIFHDEVGSFIDSLADLETDEEIINKCLNMTIHFLTKNNTYFQIETIILNQQETPCNVFIYAVQAG